MRAALLFCGRIKGFEACSNSFKEFILTPLLDAGYNVDSFAYLNRDNHHTNIGQFISNYHIRVLLNNSINISHLDPIPLHHTKNARKNSYKMYGCWYGAFCLMTQYQKDRNINYDLIIYMRADQAFTSPIYIPSDTKENKLYVPEGNDHGEGLNDQFAMGNYRVMKHYVSISKFIHHIYDATGEGFHTETYVKYHNHFFPIIRFKLNYELTPLRL